MEEEAFEVKMLDQVTKLDQLTKALEKRIEAVETTINGILIIGRYKKLHCAHNIGGVCRFLSHGEPSIGGGVKAVKLEDEKYHPEVTDAFCASCPYFVPAPLP